MKTVVVTCDTCGRDITYTGNSVDYRIAVVNQSLPSRGGAVTDMMIYPPLEHDYYFCNLTCLRGHSVATGVPKEPEA